MKNVWKFPLVLFAFLAVGGCSDNNETTIEETDPVEEVSEEEELHEAPSYTYPLSGMEAEEEQNHRIISVLINNDPAARPQSGLSKADIVYEILSEGTITRLVALYQSQFPDKVGPVRSAREYHVDLVQGFDGMLVAHGYSPTAEKLLREGKVDNINGISYDGSLFQRSSDRKAPHNSYIRYEDMLKGFVNEKGYDVTGDVPALDFYENEEIHVVGNKVNEIEVNYLGKNNIQYIYNEASGYYERYNGELQTVEYETNDPILISNLLVLETEHRVLDDQGRRSIDLTSGGRAILFQSGIMNEVTWENRNGQLIPVQDGEPVRLKPGQTWINVVPSDPGLEEALMYE
ncbi:DUF3048 domain-containing protein [Halalkalibacter okhensis]|uniref:Lipoprotein YerB n=1 Tax=Halalkalibacter okhensis TaxID=333138 RepID=A0A0B0I9Z0_9BACI|nr:DUF3048 domain-containing protein [Halalkalibacter okhensis]KHF38110.1 lipoprotein YerB [Halalkalibacter okhensis]